MLVIDGAEAAKIYYKLRPYVEEIHEISPDGPWGCITGKLGKKQGPTWVMAGFVDIISFICVDYLHMAQ